MTTLCFLWHMHQPFYKDLWTGEYKLPWTRLHAMKDYAGMVEILGEFPRIHQTFNLVPSMLAQIEEYAEGKASDPFLDCALEPAESLTEAQRNFIVKYFFQVHVERIIHRYPRYWELYQRRERRYSVQDLRDLQIYSQIAWFDEDLLARDEELRSLIAKGRDFSREDQIMVARKESESLKRVLPVYREYAAKGQIEISTTPFYHPILPLLCDSDIARVPHPGVPLLVAVSICKVDARVQLERSRAYIEKKFGVVGSQGGCGLARDRYRMKRWRWRRNAGSHGRARTTACWRGRWDMARALMKRIEPIAGSRPGMRCGCCFAIII